MFIFEFWVLTNKISAVVENTQIRVQRISKITKLKI